MFNTCKFETVLWGKILGPWMWSLKTREFRYIVPKKSGTLITWKYKGNSENEGQLCMKKSSVSRGQNRSRTHAVSCIQGTQIVTHWQFVALLGTTWKSPSVTLVEGKGKAVPVHRKKKYYKNPWRKVPFKKLTPISQSVSPHHSQNLKLHYLTHMGLDHYSLPKVRCIQSTPSHCFTIIFAYVSRVSSSL